MAAMVKLYNEGKRSIFGKTYVLKPKEGMAFLPEEAAKLKRLYPHELLALDDVKSQFDGIPDQPPADGPKAALPDLSDKQAEESPIVVTPKKGGFGLGKKKAPLADDAAIAAELAAQDAAVQGAA